jgi:hypothetical protein
MNEITYASFYARSWGVNPVRSRSTGFSLCGFDSHRRRTTHRLKPVLAKPALP